MIKAPIRNITDFGIFIALGPDIDGMIHESDLSFDGNSSDLLKGYNKGDEVECKVLSIDTDKERVSLGIKQLSDAESASSSSEFKKGDVVTCTVAEVQDDGLEVTAGESTTGFIKKTDLSTEKSDQKTDRFAAGDRLDAKITSISKSGKLNLSIKALEMAEREKAVKEYGSTDSGASLGDILGAALKAQK